MLLAYDHRIFLLFNLRYPEIHRFWPISSKDSFPSTYILQKFYILQRLLCFNLCPPEIHRLWPTSSKDSFPLTYVLRRFIAFGLRPTEIRRLWPMSSNDSFSYSVFGWKRNGEKEGETDYSFAEPDKFELITSSWSSSECR